MISKASRLYVFLLALFLPLFLSAFESYQVNFQGDASQEVLEVIKTASQLFNLQKNPPGTPAGLRHRAEADIEKILKALHSYAYYNANVSLSYNFETDPPQVNVHITTGPVYPFSGFSIVPISTEQYEAIDWDCISLEEIGITIGNPAYPEDIIHAEDDLLELLEELGYPLCYIAKRDVIVDQSTQSVYVMLQVDVGPLAYFGETTVSGNCLVKNEFFSKKIAYSIGSRYRPCLIERTHSALEASGLFSTIAVTRDETLDENGLLPMRIEVSEARHRSVSLGVAYNTEWGPGVTAEWEHRNIRGLGERINVSTEIWRDDQEARLLYVKPDFLCRNQDLLQLIEFQHETTKGYTESSVSLSALIERHFRPNSRFSYGLTYKWLQDSRSDVNGTYNLIKVPMNLRWSNANSVLDPTQGQTIIFKMIPSLQFLEPQFAYCINTLALTTYLPLDTCKKYVVAAKAMLGSIWGSSRRTIPSSERFYEGSDNSLRGYRYLTVSPLRDCDKPIGGRSLMIYTLEMRVRAWESFSWVVFYDVGNVYAEIVPQLDHKLLQAVGWGIRYHTPVGPLRLDLAVPLDRRRHLDNRFQIYLSIGQAF